MTFNFTLISTTTVGLHLAAYLWPTANWNRLNSCMSGERRVRLLPAQQHCSFATRPTHTWRFFVCALELILFSVAEVVFSLENQHLSRNLLTAYVSRFPGEEFKPEFLNLTVKHLLKIMIWCCMARSEFGHCRWNCQCDQMHRYTAEVRGAISIALFQKAYPFCTVDNCHLAKLVSNWKGQNNTRTLTLPTQSQDMNPIENLWHKITLEIVKRHPTIKRKLIELLTATWNRGVTHNHLVKLSTQFRHSAQKRLWVKVGPKHTNPSSKRKSGLLKTTICWRREGFYLHV